MAIRLHFQGIRPRSLRRGLKVVSSGVLRCAYHIHSFAQFEHCSPVF
jgi:hypothetical protein